MSSDPLKQSIKQLQDELGKNPSMDSEFRERVESVLGDIDEWLSQEESESLHTNESLVERLRASLRQFEDAHPTLVSLIGQVADALGRMGI